jgi:hypothetical protein
MVAVPNSNIYIYIYRWFYNLFRLRRGWIMMGMQMLMLKVCWINFNPVLFSFQWR